MAKHQGISPAMPSAPHGHFIRDVNFKFKVSCFVTHAPIAFIRRILATRELDFGAVRGIEIRFNPAARDICEIPHPATPLEVKFSTAHAFAMTLCGTSTKDIASFEDSAFFAALRGWREKVELVRDADAVLRSRD